MSNLIPFENTGALMEVPDYLKAKATVVNAEIYTAPSFPVLSIKGKVFTIVRSGDKKVLTHPNDDDLPIQSINVVAVRANTAGRTFYADKYDSEHSDGAVPTCFSNDGVAPDDQSKEKQSKACATCPHAVWGTKDTESGKGTACSPVTRLAITDPDMRAEVMLVRVPPASRKAFAAVVDIAKQRGVPYNAIALKMAFVRDEATPKLSFTPIGFLSQDVYAKVEEAFDTQIVKDIVGHVEKAAKVEAEVDVSEAELAAAINGPTKAAAKAQEPAAEPAFDLGAAVADVGTDEAPAAETKPKATKKASTKPKAEPTVVDTDSLMAGLDAFLGTGTDD